MSLALSDVPGTDVRPCIPRETVSEQSCQIVRTYPGLAEDGSKRALRDLLVIRDNEPPIRGNVSAKDHVATLLSVQNVAES